MKISSTALFFSSLAAVFVADSDARPHLGEVHFPNPNRPQHDKPPHYKPPKPSHDKLPEYYLKGAVQVAASEEFYNFDGHPSVAVDTDNDATLSDDSSYTYQFRMDLLSPLSVNNDGEARIDSCIGWGVPCCY